MRESFDALLALGKAAAPTPTPGAPGLRPCPPQSHELGGPARRWCRPPAPLWLGFGVRSPGGSQELGLGAGATPVLSHAGVPITKPEPVPHTEQAEEPRTQAPVEETEAAGCAGSGWCQNPGVPGSGGDLEGPPASPRFLPAARLLVPKAEALPEGDGEEQAGGGDAGAVQGHGSLELGCSGEVPVPAPPARGKPTGRHGVGTRWESLGSRGGAARP